MNPQFWWYLSRASGLIAWLVLVLALVWGVLLGTRLLKPYDKPAWLLDLHRWFGGVALLMVGVHIAALAADSYVEFSLGDLLIPFLSPYRTLAVALGVLSLYLLVIVQVSSLALRRIPTRWWRRAHMTAYLLVTLVAWHGFLSGSDVRKGWYAVSAVVLTAVGLLAVVVRVLRPKGTGAPARRSAAAAQRPASPGATVSAAPAVGARAARTDSSVTTPSAGPDPSPTATRPPDEVSNAART